MAAGNVVGLTAETFMDTDGLYFGIVKETDISVVPISVEPLYVDVVIFAVRDEPVVFCFAKSAFGVQETEVEDPLSLLFANLFRT